MAKLPKNVQEQGKRADELLKKLTAQNPPAAAPDPGITPPAPPVTPPAPADPPAPPVTPAPAPPAEPPAAPAPGTEPPPPPPPAACPECAKWAHKFSVLQGKYDAEVPRYTYRISFLENQIEDLKKQIDRAEPVVDPAAPGAAPKTASEFTGFTDLLKTSDSEPMKKFRENFPDFIEPMGAILNEFGGRVLKQSEERIAAIEKSSTETKQSAFVRALNEAHPDWQTVCQTDPNWPMWLNKTDRYGRKPLDVLKDAQAKLNPEVVVNLLTDFKREIPGNPPAPPAPSTPAPPDPAKFVTPPSGPSQGAPVVTPQGQVEPVSRSYINQFYQDKAKGRYRGKEKEAESIEAKINAALAAGKVTK